MNVLGACAACASAHTTPRYVGCVSRVRTGFWTWAPWWVAVDNGRKEGGKERGWDGNGSDVMSLSVNKPLHAFSLDPHLHLPARIQLFDVCPHPFPSPTAGSEGSESGRRCEHLLGLDSHLPLGVVGLPNSNAIHDPPHLRPRISLPDHHLPLRGDRHRPRGRRQHLRPSRLHRHAPRNPGIVHCRNGRVLPHLASLPYPQRHPRTGRTGFRAFLFFFVVVAFEGEVPLPSPEAPKAQEHPPAPLRLALLLLLQHSGGYKIKIKSEMAAVRNSNNRRGRGDGRGRIQLDELQRPRPPRRRGGGAGG